MKKALVILAFLLLTPLMSPAASEHQSPAEEQVSIGTTRLASWAAGEPGNDMSLAFRGSLSADGRYVTWFSKADNFVSGDTNDEWDVFVRDLRPGEGGRVRVSVASDGTEGNGYSSYPVISADGRYVAFQSDADNLVPGDDNNRTDVFVHDLESGQTTALSVSPGGLMGNDDSTHPAISADGRRVVFESWASNLVDGSNEGNIYLRNTQFDQTFAIDRAITGPYPDGGSYYPSISADGNVIAYWSNASNLVVGDDNGECDLFVHIRDQNDTLRATTSTGMYDCGESLYIGSSPSLSADGNLIAFHAPYDDILPEDTNGYADVYVYNLTTGEIELASVTSEGEQYDHDSYFPAISANGRFVAFENWKTRLHDLETGKTTVVSVSSDGEEANMRARMGAISAAGRYVTFWSRADNLFSSDSNDKEDVFRHERTRSFAVEDRCPGKADRYDIVADRGIRFVADSTFHAIEVRMDGDYDETYAFTAELRRSEGFLGEPEATARVWLSDLPIHPGFGPYHPVRIDFEEIQVDEPTAFTLKFTDFYAPEGGHLVIEAFPTSREHCSRVDLTYENDVAEPTIAGEPAGFKILRERAPGGNLTSWLAAPAPIIDGQIDPDEWQHAESFNFQHGRLYVKNDNHRLYLLLNLVDDPGDDWATFEDMFNISFDVDRDGEITPNADLNYTVLESDQSMLKQTYLGPGSLDAGFWSFSSYAPGFDCYLGDNTAFEYTTSWGTYLACMPQRVWEIAIDLDEIGAAPGDSIRMGLQVESASPQFEESIPLNLFHDFTDLIEIDLAPPLPYEHEPDPDAVFAYEENPFEITQAIQTRDNSLLLAAHKSTVARVYVHYDLAGAAPDQRQPVMVYLFGIRHEDGEWIDLPGSPLAQLYYAPLTNERWTLEGTANFQLPASWLLGDVAFYAYAVDMYGNQLYTSAPGVWFLERKVPVVWFYRVNTGTEETPSLPTNAFITSNQRAMEAVYPVHDVNFVEKEWLWGPVPLANVISDLNQSYRNALLYWYYTKRSTGKEPFPLPDQLFGFTSDGGGKSNPLWYNGQGIAARGGPSVNRELTMSHEIGHNMDPATVATGTWGRHVADDSVAYNANFGCGAPGPDPEWPEGNDNIQENGFDTSLAWVETAARHTVVWDDHPDFMSYCNRGTLPSQWISPYRWEHLFNRLAPESGARSVLSPTEIEDVIYVSGQVNRDGSGSLEPLYIQPGLPFTPTLAGEYAIEVQDGGGLPLESISFQVVFTDVENTPLDWLGFNFVLPLPSGAAGVVLKREDQVLASRAASDHAPTVEWLAPSGGEVISDTFTLAWTANDLDSDPLEFLISYSPDEGDTWHPVAPALTATTYEVDAGILPGGDGGKFRLIATDGFHNVEALTSGTFSVTNSAPQVFISHPQDGMTMLPGETFMLEGGAHDLEDGTIADSSLIWELDGEMLAVGSSTKVALEVGRHEVALLAYDGDGNVTRAEIQIWVGWYRYVPLVFR